MSQPRKRFQYDLTKITAFDHAAIYAYELTQSLREAVSTNQQLSMLHEVGQHEDMFNAYYYAQETVLKEIRQKGIEHINGDDIIRWLNEAHRLMANTVAHDIGQPEYAGQYSHRQVVIWHQSTIVENLLNKRYLWEAGYQNEKTFHPDIFGELTKLNVDITAAKKYLEMLHAFRSKDSSLLNSHEIKDLEWYKTRLPPEVYQAELTVKKLIASYNLNKLTQEEREAIEKLMKLGCPPQEIPACMKVYAENLASAWSKCNGNNMDELTSLCYQGFQGETDIHAYFDFNGRLGAWLVNVICESLGRRSFVMRKEGDSNNFTSDYEQAMKDIDKTSKPFKIFCARGIRNAEQGKGYNNINEKEMVALRVQLANKYAKFNAEFPGFDFESWVAQSSNTLEIQLKTICLLAKIDVNDLTQEQIQILYFTFMLIDLASHREQQRSSLSPLAAVSSVKYQYTDNEKQDISQWLCHIAEIPASAYKMYNNGKILLEVDSLKTAENISGLLNLTNAMKAQAKRNTNSGSYVVLVENISFKRFAKIISLEGWLEQQKENVEGGELRPK